MAILLPGSTSVTRRTASHAHDFFVYCVYTRWVGGSMKRLLFTIALAIFAGPAAAQSVMSGEQAIPIALKLVETLSRYKNIPPIRFWVELNPEDMCAQTMQVGMAGDHRQIAAIYSCPYHTMYLRQGLNFDEPGPLSAPDHCRRHPAQSRAGARL